MHVGRIGALATTLGIGWAVAAAAGTAAAQPSGAADDPGSVSASGSSVRQPHTATPAAVRRATPTIESVVGYSGSDPAPVQSTLAWSVMAVAQPKPRKVSTSRATQLGTAAAGTGPVMSPNLLVNPGAEVGDASLSGNSAVSIPGWTLTGTPTVIGYGTPRNSWPIGLSFKTPDLPVFMGFPATGTGPGDTKFFGGGNVTTSTLTQTVDLGAGFDSAGVAFNLSGQLGGWLINPSAASVKVDFLDANKTYLGSSTIGPVNMFDRFFQTGLMARQTSGILPDDTRYAKVTLNLRAWTPLLPGFNVDYNSAFADNISFTVGADLPTPPDPTPAASTVGQLDHVFMVYMENKGYDDIVGSPNAPFLNSLINAYGFANNYYGLTHPSLPNYYPIVGGTDFGLTYNCSAPCIEASTTLVSNIDAAGKTWRGYAQSMPYPGALEPSGDYSLDQLPFAAFKGIGDNPTYAAQHLFPLEQMALDLRSRATAPNYAWFAANEDFNGEGPVDFPWGTLRFAVSQITPGHQYNVAALDEFLSMTVPVVLKSEVWNDPAGKSVLVVTFDEDNNNTSLGFGNEGNHIVTVVIPSPGAVAAGMRGGPFVATGHYDHYSLLRMIEDSLGLPALTNNDLFAAPMNEFWDGTATAGAGTLV